MADIAYASNAKANTALGFGIGSGVLSLFGNGLGNLLGGGMYNGGVRWVSQPEFEQGQRIASLESENALLKAEKNTDSKMSDLYRVVNSDVRALEKEIAEIKANQNVVNTQLVSGINVLQNQVSVLNGLTATKIPITNVCPQPMPQYNDWTAPTTGTTT